MNPEDDKARPRELVAMQMRYEGKSFREIGDALGVSSTRAQQLFQVGERAVIAGRVPDRPAPPSAAELGLEKHPVLVHPEDWSVVRSLLYVLRAGREQALSLDQPKKLTVHEEQEAIANAPADLRAVLDAKEAEIQSVRQSAAGQANTAADVERERWQVALAQTWKMVEMPNEESMTDSFSRGRRSGFIEALEALRANLKPPKRL